MSATRDAFAVAAWGERGKACLRKHRFASREAASGYVGKDGFKVIPYHCPVCDGWHLTKHLFRVYS